MELSGVSGPALRVVTTLGLVMALAAGTACSSGEPLQQPVDLSGEWTLSDSIYMLPYNNPLQATLCKTWGRPMHVWLSYDSVYGAVEQFGGTISCAYDGVFEEPRPLGGHPYTFWLTVSSDSVLLYHPDEPILYWGAIVSPDRLTGTIDTSNFMHRHGTWELIRSR